MIEHKMYNEEDVKRSCEINYHCKLCPAKFATPYAIEHHLLLLHPCMPVEERIE